MRSAEGFPSTGTIIAALVRRADDSSRSRCDAGCAPCGLHTTTGGAADRSTSARCVASRRSIRTGATSAERRSTASSWIEFIGERAADIRGRVLEIAAPDYTTRYGTDVKRVDILMAKEGNPQATIVGDLDRRAADPERRVRLRDRDADAAVRLRRPRGAGHAASDPRARWGAARHGPRDHEDLAARGRGVRRVVALHGPLRAPARRGGFRRRERPTSRRTATCSARRGSSTGSPPPTSRPEELAARDPLYEVIVGLRAVRGAG